MPFIKRPGSQLSPEIARIRTISGNLCRFYGIVSQLAFSYPYYGAGAGAEHPDVAMSLNNLATLYQDQGRYGEAEAACAARALAIMEQRLGPDHPHVEVVRRGYLTLLQQPPPRGGRHVRPAPDWRDPSCSCIRNCRERPFFNSCVRATHGYCQVNG